MNPFHGSLNCAEAAELPFAMKLAHWLGRNGVKTQFRPTVAGGKIDGVDTHQLVTFDDPEALAELIFFRCGSHVEFLELSLLPLPIACYSAYQRYNGVWVRHIVDYQVFTDTYVHRWDVLVRRVTAAAIPLQGELK